MNFKVKKAIKILKNTSYISYFVCDPYIPVFHICKFLDIKGKNSHNTQKTYAYILANWLNHLDTKLNKKYYEINIQDIKKYIEYLIFFNQKGQYILTPELCYKTLKGKGNVIVEFYMFLLSEVDSNENALIIYNKNMKYNYPLSFNIEKLKSSTENTLNLFLTRYKRGRKENYIIEYTDIEIEIISSNFSSLRDIVIFKLTLFGFRIDEVLSIYLEDFNFQEKNIKPSRSKTNKHRIVEISSELSILINNYIQTNRLDAVFNSGYDSPYLFVNHKQGKYCGKEVSYQTFYKSLKRAAQKAGFDTTKIRTHSGRSTSVMNDLEKGMPYEIIRHKYGWNNPISITPYIDEQSKKLMKKASKFIYKQNKGQQ
ncbi:hypothetical protein ALC152_19970 [Arcobacter sp. 15-2]|uniref:tyrosine-type recombinase/integrase n=1 Tax=Arcobacter sp. 15-2 TaxID=3374109 RepID=UPI00399C942F